MFLKNKNIIFKIRRSKVTDYAALTIGEKCHKFCHTSVIIVYLCYYSQIEMLF